MKKIIVLGWYLFVVSLFVTCHRSEVEPPRFLDGSPRIKSISFSGISSDDVSIDQQTRTIWVVMPAKAPDYVDIQMELTDNAEWSNKQSGIKGSSLFGCDSCSRITLNDKTVKANSSEFTYQIKRKPSASLQVDVLTTPLQYTIRNPDGMELDIPMLNLYGNKLPREVRLTHDKTGESLLVKRDSALSSAYPSSYRIHSSARTNRLAIYLYDEKLMPGNYHIDLIMDDNSMLEVAQPVQVAAGTAEFNYEFESYLGYSVKDFGYRLETGNILTISGNNLFEGEIAIDWLDNQDKVYKLSNLTFDRYGRQVQIPVPTSFLPGQYIMRVWQNDTRLPYSYCLRVNITGRASDRPVIGTIGEDSAPCSLHDPVSISRGVRVDFTSSLKQQVLTGISRTAVLKLVAVSNQDTYYGTVVAYNANRGWDPAESITLPTTIPPGLYTAVLQLIDTQKAVISESEPYGRIINVK